MLVMGNMQDNCLSDVSQPLSQWLCLQTRVATIVAHAFSMETVVLEGEEAGGVDALMICQQWETWSTIVYLM